MLVSNARFQLCVLNIRFHFITPRQVGMLSYILPSIWDFIWNHVY